MLYMKEVMGSSETFLFNERSIRLIFYHFCLFMNRNWFCHLIQGSMPCISTYAQVFQPGCFPPLSGRMVCQTDFLSNSLGLIHSRNKDRSATYLLLKFRNVRDNTVWDCVLFFVVPFLYLLPGARLGDSRTCWLKFNKNRMRARRCSLDAHLTWEPCLRKSIPDLWPQPL